MVKDKKVKVVKVRKEKVPVVKKVRENKRDVPLDIIERMNFEHQDWKTTKPVQYDKDGLRIQ